MQSSKEREARSYQRAAVICFICVAVCLFYDIRRYVLAGRIIFDVEFFISLLLYAVLVFLGIRSIRKGKKRRRDTP